MSYGKRSCAAIHDISGVGKCSLTVALPILSACGVETAVLPTAVLSTHTGGFTGYTYTDLTNDLMPIARHWKETGCKFTSLYSGFLGSADQIDMVKDIFQMFRTPETLVMVDPVMGDGGKLYVTYTKEMADGMSRLCAAADIVVPNMTEACYMLGIPFDPGPYTEEKITRVLEGLCKMGPKMAVLTGVWFTPDKLGAACLESSTGKVEFLMGDTIEGAYHGTGDVFASTLLASLLNGMSLRDACAMAVEFTCRVIITTRDESEDVRFGPKFEVHLPWLAAQMERQREKC